MATDTLTPAAIFARARVRERWPEAYEAYSAAHRKWFVVLPGLMTTFPPAHEMSGTESAAWLDAAKRLEVDDDGG